MMDAVNTQEESPASNLGSDSRAHIKLACQACQRKKIRCDRTFPCGQCEKSSRTCVPSSRKPRTRHAGKKAIDLELRNRISKLESLVETLSGEVGVTGDSPPEQEHGQASEPKHASSVSVTKLIGMPFWSTLTTEVQALRDALEEDEDEEDQSLEPSPSAAIAANDTANADLLIVPPASVYVMPGALSEPSMEMESELYRIYFANIDPVFKVLHKPSVQPFLEYNHLYLNQSADTPPNKALKAAMWFASVTSLPESDGRFDVSRFGLLSSFRRHCDVALTKADLINTSEVATLQAAVIYIAASRLTDPSKRPWTLTALVARIAQGMGLQHEQPAHTAYQKELRRRLWHQIRVLDAFSSIDRGSEILLPHSSFSTPPPSNVNDEDFDTTTALISQRESGLSDMTFTMMAHQATSLNMALLTQGTDSWQLRFEKAQMFGKEIQEKYLRFCDRSQPFHRFLLAVGHAMTASTILRAVRPMQKLSGSIPPRVDSPFVLQLAVNSLHAGEQIHDDPEADGWRWIFWVQWHALAVALAGLCSIRGTELARTAWALVDKAYERNSSGVADTRNGMLWRPVEKLYRKARAFRDEGSATPASTASPPRTNMAGLDIMHSTPLVKQVPEQIQPGQPARTQPLQQNSAQLPAPPIPTPTATDQWFPNSAPSLSSDLSNTAAGFGNVDMSWMDWETIMEDISAMPPTLGLGDIDINAVAPSNVDLDDFGAVHFPPDVQGGNWEFGPQ